MLPYRKTPEDTKVLKRYYTTLISVSLEAKKLSPYYGKTRLIQSVSDDARKHAGGDVLSTLSTEEKARRYKAGTGAPQVPFTPPGLPAAAR